MGLLKGDCTGQYKMLVRRFKTSMKDFKDLIVIHFVNEAIAGGVLKVALKLAKNLTLLNVPSFVVTLYTPPLSKAFFKEAELIVPTIRPFMPSSLNAHIGGLIKELFGRTSLLSLSTIASICRKRICWIICHNLTPIHYAIKIKSMVNAKLAIIVHNPTYPPSIINYVWTQVRGKPLRKYLYKAIEYLTRADLVLAIHEYNVRLTRELYGIDAKPLKLGAEPIPTVPHMRGNYILIPARLSIGKNVHKLAEAVAMYDKSTPLIVAGAIHSTTPKVIKRIRSLNLRNCKIIYNVPHDMLNKLYKGCRVVLFGLSETDFLMPGSYGAPLICLKQKYAGEILLHGVHGFIIDSNEVDPRIYAEYVAKIMADERLAWDQGYNAWKYIKERHTWLHRARELLEYLNKYV